MPHNLQNVCNHDDNNLKSLPANRTIIFDCYNATTSFCVKAKFSVNNFQAGKTPILIQLNFTIDLHNIEAIVTDDRDTFVILPSIELMRNDDAEG